MKNIILAWVFLVGAGWAETLYDYDADGRLLSSAAGGDFSMLDPTPVHNLSDVMVMGDANTNGMPDSLEAYLAGYWGPEYDPMTCDSDGDGVCDWNEWMMGTNPYRADSSFALWGSGISGGGGPLEPYDYTVRWQSLPFKTYSVEYRWDLTDPVWITGATNLVATPPVNSWTHEDITNRHTFYRILTYVPVPPPPPSTNTTEEGGQE